VGEVKSWKRTKRKGRKLIKRTWSQLPILRIVGAHPAITAKRPAHNEVAGRAPSALARSENPVPVWKSRRNPNGTAERQVSVALASANKARRLALPYLNDISEEPKLKTG
jgi:hypothetical protein